MMVIFKEISQTDLKPVKSALELKCVSYNAMCFPGEQGVAPPPLYSLGIKL